MKSRTDTVRRQEQNLKKEQRRLRREARQLHFFLEEEAQRLKEEEGTTLPPPEGFADFRLTAPTRAELRRMRRLQNLLGVRLLVVFLLLVGAVIWLVERLIAHTPLFE